MSSRRVRTAGSRPWMGSCVIGAMVALCLSGCGESTGPAEFSAADTVLTKKQVTAALLTPSELGKGFVRDRSDDQSSSPEETGCVKLLDDADNGPEPQVKAEAEFKRSGKLPFPFVQTEVASFATSEDMAASIQAMSDALEKCHKLEMHDDGMSMVIDLTTDNVPSTAAVDEQINIRGVGTLTVKKVKQKIPFGLWMSVAKVGNQGVSVMLMDINPDSARLLNKYTAKAVDRLHDVAQGENPNETKPAKPKPTDKAKAKSNA